MKIRPEKKIQAIKQNNNFNIVLALFSSDSEEIPEAGGKVQQLPIQEEDSEELESEQEQDLDRIKIHEWVEMKELPVIRSLCLRKDFWDRYEANTASCCKEIYGRRLFRRPKKEKEQIRRDIDAFSPHYY